MIKELHEKLISGETTSTKLTEEYFGKIEKKDKDIQAYLTLTKDLALEQARAVDEKIKKGEAVDILAGLPCAIKDNMCIAGVRTTAASKILDNYIAPYDATAIRKLKEKKAVFLGKTNLDEFAMGSSTENSAYQITRNPNDLERVPGGSSGGSAAAVAGDEAVWALGSDTGGSIRQPASFCGIVGLKPTYGRVSRHGLLAMASSLDQIGPLAKTVEDAAIVLSRIIGEDGKDATVASEFGKKYEDYLTGDISKIKIGVPKEYMADGMDEKVKEKFQEAVDKFKKMRAEVREISLPHSKYSLAAYYLIMPSEVSSNLARFDGIKYGFRADDQKDSDFDGIARNLFETYLDTRKYGLGKEVKRRIFLGTYALSAGYYDAYYLKAQKVRALIKKDFEETLEEVDFIFSPTTPETAFKIGEKTEDPLRMYLSDVFTISANLSGVPAISFPIGKINEEDGKELPIGGQLMGKWFDEEGILNAAHAFEIN